MTAAALRWTVGFCVALILAWPTATAWTLDTPTTDSISDDARAWTDTAPRVASPQAPYASGAQAAVACALGDVNGDDVGDLLVLLRETAEGPLLAQARAGPDFSTILWQVPSTAERTVRCAPDITGDGVADPVTSLASQADQASGPVDDRSVDRAMQVVDGATGEAMMHRQHQDSHQGAGSSEAGVAANSSATAELLPASASAQAYLQTEVQQSGLTDLPDALPVSSLTGTARETAEMQLLNAQGAVVGTISIDEPGVDPMAMAPVPVGTGLPDVAVLTAKTATPVEEATQRVPTLSRYNPDGSLAWSVDLEATQGVPMLAPQAGDLNMDGVQEIIVTTAERGVQATPAAQYQVLSGLDGQALFDSGAPADGVVAALPLGSLPDGTPALLSAVQADGAANMTLTALDASGEAAWSVDVAAGAVPINLARDAYTGDPVGFTDLTGDGVPDVATATVEADALVLTAVNGTSGAIDWTASVAGAARVVPVSAVADARAAATANASVSTTDLLAIGNDTAGPVMTLVHGTSGEVVWRVTAELPDEAELASIAAQAAGDLDADGIQDVVATVALNTSTGVSQSVHVLSGFNGSATWSTPVEPTDAVASLSSEAGPAFEERAAAASGPDEDGGDSPALPGLALIATLVAAAAFGRRVRRT